MVKFLGALGAIAALVSVLLTAGFFIFERYERSRSLEVILETKTTLLDKDLSQKIPDLEVSINKQRINGLDAFQFSVHNDGGSALVPTDFVEPLQFSFAHIMSVLDIKNQSSSTPELSPKYAIKDSKIILEPLLLNSGDWFRFSTLVLPLKSDDEVTVSVAARITGVKEVSFLTQPRLEEKAEKPFELLYGSAASAFISMGLFGYRRRWRMLYRDRDVMLPV